jgi:hypothetical protein
MGAQAEEQPMVRQVVALAVGLVLAGAMAERAHADVYTWVDAAGNTNVSNLAPPAGARVKSVAREDPAAKARAEAARAAARDAELRALADRVAELERGAAPTMRAGPAAYAAAPTYALPPPYAMAPPSAASPPAPRFSVAMLPSTPPEDAAPSLLPSCGSLDCVPMLGSPFYAPSVVVIAAPARHHRGRATRRATAPSSTPTPRGPRRG